jgi:hypothetical protein
VSVGTTVCLLANAIAYPKGGGHLWQYLNWALGLRDIGCEVIWLEVIDQRVPVNEVEAYTAALKTRLGAYDLAECLAVCSITGEPLAHGVVKECLDLDAAAQANLLLNMRHDPHPDLIQRFRRSAFVDTDPGIQQFWIAKGVIRVAPHDVYFTIGETVGQQSARFPDGGLEWQYTPPCVALDWWPVHRSAEDARFTTVSHWFEGSNWMQEGDEFYSNDKRTGFRPYLDLPRLTTQPLELALCLSGDEQERATLQGRGWRVREAWEITSTPWDYQRYVQTSRGEFSWAKPSYVRMQTAWVSDRTLCYLASGKPAVVQHTGPSRFLPDSAGLFRFRTLEEAARCLDTVAADYQRHCRLARALAQERFDARNIVNKVLERALA